MPIIIYNTYIEIFLYLHFSFFQGIFVSFTEEFQRLRGQFKAPYVGAQLAQFSVKILKLWELSEYDPASGYALGVALVLGHVNDQNELGWIAVVRSLGALHIGSPASQMFRPHFRVSKMRLELPFFSLQPLDLFCENAQNSALRLQRRSQRLESLHLVVELLLQLIELASRVVRVIADQQRRIIGQHALDQLTIFGQT